MASGKELFDRMRRTKTGYGDRDFHRVLLYYGFTLSRRARHGAIFRHPDLSNHENPRVRQVMIPTGRSLPAYVAGKVVACIEALLDHKEGDST